MKQLFIILASLIMTSWAYAENRLLFVRMNDGNTEYFIFNEIDSLRYSKIDLDSVAYSDVMTQEIWTRDTVYRYRIEDIKELGFQTPAPIVRDSVIDLAGDISQYVERASGIEVILRPDVPERLMPTVGDKLFCEFPAPRIPDGFMGRVTSIVSRDGMYVLECEYVTMEDLYTEYYGVQESYAVAMDTTNPLGSPAFKSNATDFTNTVEFDPYHIDRSIDFGTKEGADSLPFPSHNDIDYNGKITASLDIKPSLTVSRITVIRDGVTETCRTSISINGDYSFNIAGRFHAETSKATNDVRLATVSLGYGFVVSLDVYLFFKASATMGFEYTYKNNLSAGMSIYQHSGPIGSGNSTEFKTNMDIFHAGEHTLEFTSEGEFRAGIGFKPAIRWGEISYVEKIKDVQNRKRVSLLCLEPKIETGIKFTGKGLFTVHDLADCDSTTTLYSNLVDESGIDIGPSLTASLHVGALNFRHQIGNEWEPELYPWMHFHTFPKFGNPTFSRVNNTTGKITYPIEGNSGIYRRVGLIVLNGQSSQPSYLYFDKPYLNSILSFDKFDMEFDYDPDKDIHVNPFVEILPGVIVKGLPRWPFRDTNFYPYIVSQSADGIGATAVSLPIGSASGEDIIVQEGAPFPYTNY